MGLEYAPLCRVCGKRKTENANQVCSICGNMGRRLYKGICSSCRNASHAQDMACYLPDAIADVRKTLVVLEHLDNGESYAEAGAAAGMSKSAAYYRVKRVFPKVTFCDGATPCG